MPENRIRELRKARGLTIDQLAERAGISQPHLSRLESHKRLLLVPVAERLAVVLGVPTKDVLGLGDGDDSAVMSGFSDDLVPYEAHDGDPLAGLAGVNRYLFVVNTDAVDKAKVYRNDIVIVDDSEARIKRLQPLEIVRVRWHPPEDFMQPVTLLRQFVPPRLLITNSSKGNLPTIDMDDDDAHIVGVVVGAHRSFGA